MNLPVKFQRQKVCTVVNKYQSDFDVNIQRGTMFGNPCWDSETPVEDFEKYFIQKIRNKEITRDHLETLRFMRLGCTCVPHKKCHGEVIAKIVNKLFKDEDHKGIEGLCKF